jgi:hypothetical protein
MIFKWLDSGLRRNDKQPICQRYLEITDRVKKWLLRNSI